MYLRADLADFIWSIMPGLSSCSSDESECSDESEGEELVTTTEPLIEMAEGVKLGPDAGSNEVPLPGKRTRQEGTPPSSLSPGKKSKVSDEGTQSLVALAAQAP